MVLTFLAPNSLPCADGAVKNLLSHSLTWHLPLCSISWLYLWQTSYLFWPNYISPNPATITFVSFPVSSLTSIPQLPVPLLPLSFTPNLTTVILSTINSLSLNYPVSSTSRTLLLVLSLLVKATKSCHISPILRSLHWLRINERIEYKLLSLTYKVLTITQPPYLYNLVSVQCPRSTRSLFVVTLASSPSSSSLKITDRSFRYASQCLWNQLPLSLRQPYSGTSSDSPTTSPITSSSSVSPLCSSIAPMSPPRRTGTFTGSCLRGTGCPRCCGTGCSWRQFRRDGEPTVGNRRIRWRVGARWRLWSRLCRHHQEVRVPSRPTNTTNDVLYDAIYKPVIKSYLDGVRTSGVLLDSQWRIIWSEADQLLQLTAYGAANITRLALRVDCGSSGVPVFNIGRRL